MDHNSWVAKLFSGLFLGGALGNLAIIIGALRFINKRWKQQKHYLERLLREHKEMYDEHCRRTKKTATNY